MKRAFSPLDHCLLFLMDILCRLLKIAGFKLSSLPGYLLNKCIRNTLEKFININQSNKDNKLIIITGTNGKSTTTGLVAHILKQKNKIIITNAEGANLISGIITALFRERKKIKQADLILEVDEATVKYITKSFPADGIIITNFFRDQLDRYGELLQTMQLVANAIKLKDRGLLFLNADDPNVTYIPSLIDLKKEQIIYYGIKDYQQPYTEYLDLVGELSLCPQCQTELSFQNQWLAHLGDYKCSQCNYQRPVANHYLDNIQLNTKTVKADYHPPNSKTETLQLNIPGIFNLYNALAGLTLIDDLYPDLDFNYDLLNSYHALFGRSAHINYHGRQMQVFLIKNPTGLTEILKVIIQDPHAKIMFAIKDEYADGRDISWLWDGAFELLQYNNLLVQPIYLTGCRGSDLAIRLKYIGAKNLIYDNNLKSALQKFSQEDEESNLYILPTYTALLDIYQLLKLSY